MAEIDFTIRFFSLLFAVILVFSGLSLARESGISPKRWRK